MKVAVLLWAAWMLLGARRPAASAPTHRPVIYEIAIDGGIDPAVEELSGSMHDDHRGSLAGPAFA